MKWNQPMAKVCTRKCCMLVKQILIQKKSGIEGRGVTSLQCLTNRTIDVNTVAETLIQQFGIVFQQENDTIHMKSYPNCKDLNEDMFVKKLTHYMKLRKKPDNICPMTQLTHII